MEKRRREKNITAQKLYTVSKSRHHQRKYYALLKMDVDWSSTTNCLAHSSQNTMQIYRTALSLTTHHNIPLCKTIDFTNVRRYHFSAYLRLFVCCAHISTHFHILYTYIQHAIFYTSLHRLSFHICVGAPSIYIISFSL